MIDLEVIKIGHAAMQSIKAVLERNRELLQGVDQYKLHTFERWQGFVKRFQGLDIVSRQGTVIGSVILFRKLLRKALYNVLSANNKNNTFYPSSMKVLLDKLLNQRLFFEAVSDLALDTGIVNDFTDNVMRNVYYQLANNDSKLWGYIPLVFGCCFADSFWQNSVKFNINLGALSNNGFALANAVTEMIPIYTEQVRQCRFYQLISLSFTHSLSLCLCLQTKHRKNKLLFLDIAGKSLLYLKRLYPSNKSINSLFLFLDYFIEINGKDLTHMDLESFSVPYDVIRAQIVKTLGDESGTFSEYKQVVDDEAPSGGHSPMPSSGGDEMKTN